MKGECGGPQTQGASWQSPQVELLGGMIKIIFLFIYIYNLYGAWFPRRRYTTPSLSPRYILKKRHVLFTDISSFRFDSIKMWEKRVNERERERAKRNMFRQGGIRFQLVCRNSANRELTNSAPLENVTVKSCAVFPLESFVSPCRNQIANSSYFIENYYLNSSSSSSSSWIWNVIYLLSDWRFTNRAAASCTLSV